MAREALGLSRRGLIAGLAVGVAGLGAVTVSALNRSWFTKDGRGQGSWWDRGRVSLANAGYSEWSRHVGSDFELQTGAGGSALKLVEVQPFPVSGTRPRELGRDRAFTAVFESADASRLSGDQMYAVKHSSGEMNIFFDAVTPATANGRIYAVFN